MADQVRVPDNIHSWGSITVKFRGNKYYGFTSLTYGDKRERVAVYGMGRHHAPRGRTRGKYSTEPGKLVGPKSTVQALINDLAAASSDGKSFGNVEFEAVYQFVENSEEPLHVVLERCVIDGVTASHEESADALQDELSISYLAIKRNGKYLFDATQGRP